jgi:hypothetical protein
MIVPSSGAYANPDFATVVTISGGECRGEGQFQGCRLHLDVSIRAFSLEIGTDCNVKRGLMVYAMMRELGRFGSLQISTVAQRWALLVDRNLSHMPYCRAIAVAIPC